MPSVCDVVVIKAGHVVNLNIANATARQVQFETNAKLEYANASAQLSILGVN